MTHPCLKFLLTAAVNLALAAAAVHLILAAGDFATTAQALQAIVP